MYTLSFRFLTGEVFLTTVFLTCPQRAAYGLKKIFLFPFLRRSLFPEPRKYTNRVPPSQHFPDFFQPVYFPDPLQRAFISFRLLSRFFFVVSPHFQSHYKSWPIFKLASNGFLAHLLPPNSHLSFPCCVPLCVMSFLRIPLPLQELFRPNPPPGFGPTNFFNSEV